MKKKKRPTAAQVLDAIREAAAKLRRDKEEKQKKAQREYRKKIKDARSTAPAKLYTSIVNPVHLPCEHRVCMCNVNSYCGHRECPTGKRIVP